MNPLESRKQMLIMESELNRVQLLKELDEIKVETQRLAEQMHVLSSLASNVSSIFEMIFKAQRAFAGTREKFPRIFSIFKSAKAGASLWSAIRAWLR